MIVVWAIVMALSLLLEFFTVDFFACCFSFGALIALILAACGLNVYWQVAIFFVVTVVALCVARPLLKRWIKKPTVPTNVDQNFGKKARLLTGVVNGESSIRINDVVWKVACNADLKQNDEVIIERVEGNKMVVTPVLVKDESNSATEIPTKEQKSKKKN